MAPSLASLMRPTHPPSPLFIIKQVVTAAGDTATFDVVDETLRVTNLGGLSVGDAANFER